MFHCDQYMYRVMLSIALFLFLFFTSFRTTKYNFCEVHPQQCNNLPEQIQNYITKTSTNQKQGESILQVVGSHLNTQPKTQTQMYGDMLKSMECLTHFFPDNATAIYENLTELMYSDEQSLYRYLSTVMQGSSDIHTININSQSHTSCNFSLQNHQQNIRKNHRLLSEQCPSRNSVLHFVNGVGFTVSGAFNNVKKMLQIVQQEEDTHFDMVTFAGPWRKQSGVVDDLLLTYMQKLQEAGKNNISRFKLLIYLKLIMSLADDQNQDEEYEKFKDFVNQRTYLQIMNSTINYNVNMHANIIKAHVLTGKEVVIVGHSQGTLYSNSIYNQLTQQEKESVGLVYVGAAASEMADGSGLYMTNPKDRVINTLLKNSAFLLGIRKPMPANLNSIDYSFLNHEFIGYLTHYRDQFLNLVKQCRSQTSSNKFSQSSSSPIIEIVLMLNQDDEYYLQIDDENGDKAKGTYNQVNRKPNGTEIFSINCGQQRVGNYTVKVVNQNQSKSGENLIVSIYAGQKISIVEVTQIGEELCIISVLKKGGVYEYEILSAN